MAGSEQNPLSPTRGTLSPRAAAEKERRRKIAAKRKQAELEARNRAANPRNPNKPGTATTQPGRDYYKDPTGLFHELARR